MAECRNTQSESPNSIDKSQSGFINIVCEDFDHINQKCGLPRTKWTQKPECLLCFKLFRRRAVQIMERLKK